MPLLLMATVCLRLGNGNKTCKTKVVFAFLLKISEFLYFGGGRSVGFVTPLIETKAILTLN